MNVVLDFREKELSVYVGVYHYKYSTHQPHWRRLYPADPVLVIRLPSPARVPLDRIADAVDVDRARPDVATVLDVVFTYIIVHKYPLFVSCYDFGAIQNS